MEIKEPGEEEGDEKGGTRKKMRGDIGQEGRRPFEF